jgi:hypothetical protein
MLPTNKLRLFSWLQDESLLPIFNSFDDPISCLNLESKFNDFSNHSDNLELVLEQAIPKAFQKLAVQHATAALKEENSFLTSWQPKLRITTPDSSQDLFISNADPYSYPAAFNMTNASAHSRFKALAPRFNTNEPPLSNLQDIMVSNANRMDENVHTGIRYWGSIQNYADYHEAAIKFSTLFNGLDVNDLNFLMDYPN